MVTILPTYLQRLCDGILRYSSYHRVTFILLGATSRRTFNLRKLTCRMRSVERFSTTARSARRGGNDGEDAAAAPPLSPPSLPLAASDL